MGTLGGYPKQAAQVLWKKFGSMAYVQQMEAAAAAVMTSFYEDFYWLDLLNLREDGDAPFCWLVHEKGTVRVSLEGNEVHVRTANAWLQALDRAWGREGEKLRSRIYVVDPRANSVCWKRRPADVSIALSAGMVAEWLVGCGFSRRWDRRRASPALRYRSAAGLTEKEAAAYRPQLLSRGKEALSAEGIFD